MASVFVNEAADRDISDIFDWIEQASGFLAVVHFDDALQRTYRQLQAFPASGVLRPWFGSNIRIVPVQAYVVIYRHDPSYEAVNVLRVVHGRRDMHPRLLRSKP